MTCPCSRQLMVLPLGRRSPRFKVNPAALPGFPEGTPNCKAARQEKGELVVVPPATIIRPTQETLKQLPGGQVIKPLSAKEVLDDELRY